MTIRYAILTVSDKGARGEREDISSERIVSCMKKNDSMLLRRDIVPDEYDKIVDMLKLYADEEHADLVLTTGGTGLSPRDVTPEATLSVMDRSVPGIAEAMRAYSMRFTNRAMLSRAVAITRNKTLIINLPGSPKAVEEFVEVFINVLEHAVETLKGSAGECGNIK